MKAHQPSSRLAFAFRRAFAGIRHAVRLTVWIVPFVLATIGGHAAGVCERGLFRAADWIYERAKPWEAKAWRDNG